MRTVLMLVLCNSSSVVAGPYAGVQLRDDAEHPVRVGGGMAFRDFELSALVDPEAVMDGQHTGDVTVGTRLGTVGLQIGWRNTAIQLAGGFRLYESVIVAATLPVARGRGFTLRAGIEVGALIAAHGEAMPTQWLSTETWQRSITTDLFLQVRYGR